VAAPFVIVFGNEKGGTGKSTLAMHAVTYLLYEGASVYTFDVDSRQGTFSRYVHNRQQSAKSKSLPMMTHRRVQTTGVPSHATLLRELVDDVPSDAVVVIDTPGSDTVLSRQAHALADVLVTPINDSFVDLDLLVHVEGEGSEVRLRPSCYADMVWEQRKQKLAQTGTPLSWIVIRNRLGHLLTKNKMQVDLILNELAKRLGFKLVAGFGERVIFRELFLKGLTLLDLEKMGAELTLSHTSARQELRSLMQVVLEKRPGLAQTGRVA